MVEEFDLLAQLVGYYFNPNCYSHVIPLIMGAMGVMATARDSRVRIGDNRGGGIGPMPRPCQNTTITTAQKFRTRSAISQFKKMTTEATTRIAISLESKIRSSTIHCPGTSNQKSQ